MWAVSRQDVQVVIILYCTRIRFMCINHMRVIIPLWLLSIAPCWKFLKLMRGILGVRHSVPVLPLGACTALQL